MKRAAVVSVLLCAGCPRGARAGDELPLQVGATLGYAFAGGSLERGSRSSDVTFGALLAALDAVYRVQPVVSLGAALSYGALIPTLCATASDCVASLGRDLGVSVVGRWHAGTWGPFEPSVSGTLGYEWLTAGLSDAGVTSRRAYRGLAAGLAGDVLLPVCAGVALGLRAELRAGLFDRSSLSAPGVDAAGSADGHAIHLWPILALRATAAF